MTTVHSWSTMVSCVSCMQQHSGIRLFLSCTSAPLVSRNSHAVDCLVPLSALFLFCQSFQSKIPTQRKHTLSAPARSTEHLCWLPARCASAACYGRSPKVAARNTCERKISDNGIMKNCRGCRKAFKTSTAPNFVVAYQWRSQQFAMEGFKIEASYRRGGRWGQWRGVSFPC